MRLVISGPGMLNRNTKACTVENWETDMGRTAVGPGGQVRSIQNLKNHVLPGFGPSPTLADLHYGTRKNCYIRFQVGTRPGRRRDMLSAAFRSAQSSHDHESRSSIGFVTIRIIISDALDSEAQLYRR